MVYTDANVLHVLRGGRMTLCISGTTYRPGMMKGSEPGELNYKHHVAYTMIKGYRAITKASGNQVYNAERWYLDVPSGYDAHLRHQPLNILD